LIPKGRLGLFALLLLVAAVCVGLGLWQGRRLSARRVSNRIALAARALPEIDLNQVTATDSLVQRRVIARGHFDHAHTFVLRGRVEREAPGVQMVVPLRLEGRPEAVLVNRGFAPAYDAARPDTNAVDRTAEATVRGLGLSVPIDSDSGAPLEYRGTLTWRRLDLAAARARLPYPVLEIYVHETEHESRAQGAPPWPVPASLPPLTDGPHLSYMIQWFGIAAAAVAFGIGFVLRGGSRRESQGVEESRSGFGAGSPHP
jgi:surfeit locus 1 family protein